MPIGSAGVSGYANTTSGSASGLVALGGIGGSGVVEIGGGASVSYLATESSNRLDAENGNNLITEN